MQKWVKVGVAGVPLVMIAGLAAFLHPVSVQHRPGQSVRFATIRTGFRAPVSKHGYLAQASRWKESTSGLAAFGDLKLLPVWSTKGRAMYVNAAVTPAFFFSIEDPRLAEKALSLLSRLPGPTPVVFVAAGFPRESVTVALQQAVAASRIFLRGDPVVLLQGSWASYVPTLNRLVWLSPQTKYARTLSISQFSTRALHGVFRSVVSVSPLVRIARHRRGSHS